jgi:bacterioferritin-associated ferredoxin
MTQSPNPLKAFFRQPAIYLKLPSNGTYWPNGAIDFPQNRELPVYPMTAVDEITYRTPDALFSGQSVVNVIQSCIPNIKNAWTAPFVDVNSILIGIRIASYGHNMEVSTVCSNCEHEDDFELDLRNVLDQLQIPNYDETVNSGDLEIIFRPMSYEEQNHSNLEQFEQQRMIRMIPGADIPEEEKIQRMADVMRNITGLTLKAIKMSIAAIRTPNATVTDPAHIEEFLNNCDRTVFALIRDHAIKLRQTSELKPVQLKCTECGTEYEQQLTLDMANFFAPAS